MYYVVLGLLYLVSILPFPLLYLLSDFIYLVIYHLVGYRKKVVMQNLRNAFPGKSEAELTVIAKKYYRRLTDMMVESIKLLTMSRKSLQKRFLCDLSILHDLYAAGKSCQLHLGHNFNWEWANLFCMQGVPFKFLVVFMPLSSKTMNRVFIHFREKFGSVLLPANDMKNAMTPWIGKQYLIALVADQNPGKKHRGYWYPFLNQMTLFYKGPETQAKRYNIPVVFANIKRIKRGYYKAELKLAFEDPINTPDGVITEAFVKYLESKIYEEPEGWVWSHRRWKHKYLPEYGTGAQAH